LLITPPFGFCWRIPLAGVIVLGWLIVLGILIHGAIMGALRFPLADLWDEDLLAEAEVIF
jgi:hypothetical protein